jgi:uncharacterized protein
VATTPARSKDGYCVAWQAAEPKELVVIDGATHIDLYDKDEHVTPAVAKLTEFFGKHLAE